MLTKVATFKGVSSEGEPLVQIFRQGQSMRKLAGPVMPEVQEWLQGYQSEKGKIALLVNAMGGSEFWGQNVNGDVFPWHALCHNCSKHPGQDHPVSDFTKKRIPEYGYPTFLKAHPFVHHRNKDPSRAFGNVAVSCLNPRMKRVELVVIIDRELALKHDAQHVVDRIDAGEFPDVSMGCRVPYDVCTICGNKSKTRHDYCDCIKKLRMNTVLPDGRKVGVINDYPRFFDISFVFIGADKTAKVMQKLGSGEGWLPQSVQDGFYIYGDSDEDLVKAASAPYTPDPKVIKRMKGAIGSHLKEQGLSRKDTHVVGAGAAMYLHGLRPSVRDVDLFTPGQKVDHVEKIHRGMEVDSHRDWMTPGLEKQIVDEAKKVHGIPAMSLPSILAMKEHLNRPKDQADIELLNQQMKKTAAVRERVELLIHNEKGQVLGQKVSGHGGYKFPGGTLEPGQTVNQAAKREALEEVGVEVGTPRGVGVRPKTFKMTKERQQTVKPGRKNLDLKIHYRAAPALARNKELFDIEGDALKNARFVDIGTAIKAVRRSVEDKSSPYQVYQPPKLKALENLQRQFEANKQKKASDTSFSELMVRTLSPKSERTSELSVRGSGTDEKPPSSMQDGVLNTNASEPADSDRDDAEKTALVVGLHPGSSVRYWEKQDKARKALKEGVLFEDKSLLKKSESLSLDDLFSGSGSARRRQRMWKNKETGESSCHVGSGLGDSFSTMQKTASEADADLEEVFKTASVAEDTPWYTTAIGSLAGDIAGGRLVPKKYRTAGRIGGTLVGTAVGLEGGKALGKALDKSAAFKRAEILKEVGPNSVVGQVAKVLNDREPRMDKDSLDELGKGDLQKALATPSMMGMVLRPEEFQRILLSHIGKSDLADKLDKDGVTFAPADGESAPCGPLEKEHFSHPIMEMLLPLLRKRSFLGPVVRHRITVVRIAPVRAGDRKEESSPLLSKLGSAYNWYRREMLKVATHAPDVISEVPELHVELHGLNDADLFSKSANVAGLSGGSLAATLGTIPLTLMYSSSLRRKEQQGRQLGTVEKMVADHPWLSSLGVAAGVRHILKDPSANTLAQNVGSAAGDFGGRVSGELGAFGKRLLGGA